MIVPFTFNASVKTEHGTFPVDIPGTLIGENMPSELTPNELIRMGIDLKQFTNDFGERYFSDQQIIQMRVEQQYGSTKNLSEPIYVPSLGPLRSYAESKITGRNTVFEIYDKILPPVRSEESLLPFQSNSKPQIEQLPQNPLGNPEIFQPVPVNKEDFIVEKMVPGKRYSSSDEFAVFIYQHLINRYKFRIYEEVIYLFFPGEGVYKKQSPRQLDFLIHEHFGTRIEELGDAMIYSKVQEFLKRNSDLVITEENKLPQNFWAFQNGFFDIYNNHLHKNDGRFFVCNVLQCNYNINSTCPNFDVFINSISGGDPLMIQCLWETIGYLLSTDTSAKSLFVFVGKKDTGKSLLANILSGIIGENSISNLSANEFGSRFDVADLNRKHLNVCMDLPNRPLSAEAVGKIKAITGNDIIRSDVKYRDPIRFRPTARLLFGSNSLIRTELPDQAFIDRMVLIPFNFPVPKENQDHNLQYKLLQEAQGICIKAMKFYKKLRENKYNFSAIQLPKSFDRNINYEKLISVFATSYCKFTSEATDKVSSADLYSAFETFCHGREIVPLKSTDFVIRFKTMFSEHTEKKKVKINGIPVNGFTCIQLIGF